MLEKRREGQDPETDSENWKKIFKEDVEEWKKEVMWEYPEFTKEEKEKWNKIISEHTQYWYNYNASGCTSFYFVKLPKPLFLSLSHLLRVVVFDHYELQHEPGSKTPRMWYLNFPFNKLNVGGEGKGLEIIGEDTTEECIHIEEEHCYFKVLKLLLLANRFEEQCELAKLPKELIVKIYAEIKRPEPVDWHESSCYWSVSKISDFHKHITSYQEWKYGIFYSEKIDLCNIVGLDNITSKKTLRLQSRCRGTCLLCIFEFPDHYGLFLDHYI
eukprot:CAMPEP_0174254744 /NCGR_PEP_ID=MMETSP0439-20130205/4078_1 /TAXON_ID=0 /ORGANISM="Stereomyxa ramosa, Strain Chinc5" /LENGTH=270 /DNA_ID=CAMNT_0015336533 /DNA_START=116 /DNA_END=925 /DNA_ORIENTATION=-